MRGGDSVKHFGWHWWFAWRPVYTYEGEWTWFGWVWRRKVVAEFPDDSPISDSPISFHEYRKTLRQECRVRVLRV